jgi:hypothetical protein
MMRLLFFFLLTINVQSACGQTKPRLEVIPVTDQFTFWGISAPDDRVVWISANKGTVGRSMDGGKHWTFTPVKGFEQKEFRSVYAFNDRVAIVANVGSPASVLRTVDGGATWTEVYRNESREVFIDGIDFWNADEGLIYGDPIGDRMLLLKTTDAGKSWKELPESSRPSLEKGEASFASSGTGIRCYGEGKAVIATGGLISRLFFSGDRGLGWSSSNALLHQGSPTGGVFSVAVGALSQLVLAGGDFQDSTVTACALYRDAADKWKSPLISPGGTRWCVEFIGATTAVAVGPSGADITFDNGITWTPLFDDKSFHVIRKSRKGNLVVVAGSKSRLALLK